MERDYVLYARVENALDRQATERAQEKLSQFGVTILRVGLGTILLRTRPSVAKQLAEIVPGWKVAANRRGTVSVPEKRPLVQARQRVAASRNGGLGRGSG